LDQNNSTIRQELIPLEAAELDHQLHLSALAEDRAKGVLCETLATIRNLDVGPFPLRAANPEMECVLTIGTRRIPVEVKYQRKIDPLRDTEGLRTFLEKAANNAPFGLLVTQTDLETVTDPRIVALPLSTVMLLR